MPHLPPPEWLSEHKSQLKNVNRGGLLEFETKRPDGSTYIASVYPPRVISEPQSYLSFLLNAFLKRSKKISRMY